MFRLIAITLILVGCATGPDVNKVGFNPKAAEANAELGRRYMQRGDYEIAMAKLKKALSFDSKSVNGHHYIAELYRRLGEAEDAEKHYKLAIHNSENESALYNNYGVFLCGEKRVDEAMQQFGRVLTNPVYRFPEQVYENIGLCMLQNGMKKDAEENFRKALSTNSKLPNSLFELSKITLQQGRLFSARAFMTRYSETSEPSAESLWLAVEIETKLKDHKAAKTYGEQLLEKFPLSVEAENYHRLNKR